MLLKATGLLLTVLLVIQLRKERDQREAPLVAKRTKELLDEHVLRQAVI